MIRIVKTKVNIFRFISYIFLLIIGLFLSSCRDNSKYVDYSKLIIDKVVEIKICDSDDNIIGYATGTVISKDGDILTNRHVVRRYNNDSNAYEYYSNFYCRYYNEDDYFDVTIKEVSDEYDLAILESKKTTDNYFVPSDCRPKMSEEVHTIGNSNGFGLAYSRGYIAIDKIYVLYENKNNLYINVSMPINEGNSGGPLVSNSGELYGIITFRLKNKSGETISSNCYCITMSNVLDFIQNKK